MGSPSCGLGGFQELVLMWFGWFFGVRLHVVWVVSGISFHVVPGNSSVCSVFKKGVFLGWGGILGLDFKQVTGFWRQGNGVAG